VFPVVQGQCCFGRGARVAGGVLVCPCNVWNVLHCLKHGDVCENAVHKGKVDNLGSGCVCVNVYFLSEKMLSDTEIYIWSVIASSDPVD
jgi:hypothetical protein